MGQAVAMSTGFEPSPAPPSRCVVPAGFINLSGVLNPIYKICIFFPSTACVILIVLGVLSKFGLFY